MTTEDGQDILRAFKGEGPLFESMLDERARELAQVTESQGDGGLEVLVLAGALGRWALPLAAVLRVEPLLRPLPVPDLPSPLMGLALLAGRRILLADLDALAAETAPRQPDRPSHAVLLRHLPLALVVDRAEAIASVAVPANMRQGVLADGIVLLDVDRLAAKAKVGGFSP